MLDNMFPDHQVTRSPGNPWGFPHGASGANVPVMRFATVYTTVTVALAAALQNASAQQMAGDALSNPGVARASALVDSVFIDRALAEALVSGGDFGSYLMARLGVDPIPPDLKFRVVVDTERIVMHGRIADLPAEALAALGPLLGMFPLGTRVSGDIELARVGPEMIRFRLAAVRVGGVPLPEPLVHAVMLEIGRQYPALSHTGRDLYVRIPPGAGVELVIGCVRVLKPDTSDSNDSAIGYQP